MLTTPIQGSVSLSGDFGFIESELEAHFGNVIPRTLILSYLTPFSTHLVKLEGRRFVPGENHLRGFGVELSHEGYRLYFGTECEGTHNFVYSFSLRSQKESLVQLVSPFVTPSPFQIAKIEDICFFRKRINETFSPPIYYDALIDRIIEPYNGLTLMHPKFPAVTHFKEKEIIAAGAANKTTLFALTQKRLEIVVNWADPTPVFLHIPSTLGFEDGSMNPSRTFITLLGRNGCMTLYSLPNFKRVVRKEIGTSTLSVSLNDCLHCAALDGEDGKCVIWDVEASSQVLTIFPDLEPKEKAMRCLFDIHTVALITKSEAESDVERAIVYDTRIGTAPVAATSK